MLKLLDRDYLFKLILFLLAYALVPIGEIVLFIYLGNLIGNYLTFALAAVAGIGGALAALSQAQRLRERLECENPSWGGARVRSSSMGRESS